jgi:hypothetical protein
MNEVNGNKSERKYEFNREVTYDVRCRCRLVCGRVTPMHLGLSWPSVRRP